MAKKHRTPDPPRKVQAPKVRQKQATAGGGFAMPSTNVLMGVGLAGLVALGVVLIVVLSGGGSAGGDVTAGDAAKVRTALTAAGCTFVSEPADRNVNHMSDPNQQVAYETFPPSSGIQNPTPARHGNYRSPADPRQVLHNLEHGGVAIWYGPRISAEAREELDAFYDEDPNGIVVSPLRDPYPGITYPEHEPLGSKIALTAWTAPVAKPQLGTAYVATCPNVDRDAFAAFRDAFRGKGPERAPVSSLKPGT